MNIEMKTVDEAFELELSKLVECIYTSWTNDLKTLPIRFRYTTQKYGPFKAFCQVYQKNLQIGKSICIRLLHSKWPQAQIDITEYSITDVANGCIDFQAEINGKIILTVTTKLDIEQGMRHPPTYDASIQINRKKQQMCIIL